MMHSKKKKEMEEKKETRAFFFSFFPHPCVPQSFSFPFFSLFFFTMRKIFRFLFCCCLPVLPVSTTLFLSRCLPTHDSPHKREREDEKRTTRRGWGLLNTQTPLQGGGGGVGDEVAPQPRNPTTTSTAAASGGGKGSTSTTIISSSSVTASTSDSAIAGNHRMSRVNQAEENRRRRSG